MLSGSVDDGEVDKLYNQPHTGCELVFFVNIVLNYLTTERNEYFFMNKWGFFTSTTKGKP